jgi:hypothetical protein
MFLTLETKNCKHLPISGGQSSFLRVHYGEKVGDTSSHDDLTLNFRQRSMYTHNITIILVNDPLNSSLFLLNNHPSQQHGQPHAMVSCRMAKNDFEAFLADYFSFVLLDGQAYIKFLMHDPKDSVPHSFMLLRITGQPPLLYLKFAFQANASTVKRHEVEAMCAVQDHR